MQKKYHPDVNLLSEAEEIFKEATEAYEELSDINKRQRYDSNLGISFNATSRAYSSYTKSRKKQKMILKVLLPNI